MSSIIFSCATYTFITRLMKTLLQIIKPLKYIFCRYKYKFLGVIKAKNLIIIRLKVIFKKIILPKNIKTGTYRKYCFVEQYYFN